MILSATPSFSKSFYALCFSTVFFSLSWVFYAFSSSSSLSFVVVCYCCLFFSYVTTLPFFSFFFAHTLLLFCLFISLSIDKLSFISEQFVVMVDVRLFLCCFFAWHRAFVSFVCLFFD